MSTMSKPIVDASTHVLEDGRVIVVRRTYQDLLDDHGIAVHRRLINRELVDVEDAFTPEEINGLAKQLGWIEE